jgi:hypothetical protein
MILKARVSAVLKKCNKFFIEKEKIITKLDRIKIMKEVI